MYFLEYFVSLTLLSVVNCLPVKMICVQICNPEITVSLEFVNEWLSHATGIHQLRNHKDTVVNRLLKDGSTDVSQSSAVTTFACS